MNQSNRLQKQIMAIGVLLDLVSKKQLYPPKHLISKKAPDRHASREVRKGWNLELEKLIKIAVEEDFDDYIVDEIRDLNSRYSKFFASLGKEYQSEIYAGGKWPFDDTLRQAGLKMRERIKALYSWTKGDLGENHVSFDLSLLEDKKQIAEIVILYRRHAELSDALVSVLMQEASKPRVFSRPRIFSKKDEPKTPIKKRCP
jgi:hypothetical protein